MTEDRPRRTIRRPALVALALGTAALAALPPSAGTGSAPVPGALSVAAPDPAASPPATSAPATSALAAPAADAARAESRRTPVVQSVRINPVAFRERAIAAAPVRAPATITPGGPAARPAQPRITTTARPGTAAAVAIDFALAQLGLPYLWGGNGPQQGDAGFDCSGLTTFAYARAGIDLPRTAHTQYYAGPHVPAGAELLPGDLVFYGTPQRVHHVGLYLGEGRMVNAPRRGKPVQVARVRYPGDDYLGATRPAAGRDADLDEGLIRTPDLPVEVPPLPAPEAPPGPEEFLAPAVPAEEVAAPEAAADAPPSDAPPSDAPPSDALALDAPADGPDAGTEGGADAPPADGAEAAPDTTAPEEGTDGTSTPGATPDSAPPAEQTGETPTSTGPETPDQDSAAGTPDADDASTSTPADPPPAGEATPSPSTTEAPPSDAAGAETTSAPPAAEGTSEPATTEEPADPTTTEEPADPTTTEEPADPTATDEAAEPPATEEDGTATPVALTLSGTDLTLVRAERDDNGLPVAPESPDRGGLRWSPAEDERAARAVVALHPDATAPEVGTPVLLQAEDGTTTELIVRSREAVDPAAAADVAAARGETTRLVLLVTDPETDETVVVVAE